MLKNKYFININTNFCKSIFLFFTIVFIFTSCSGFSRYDGSTNFQGISDSLIEKSYDKLKNKFSRDEVVLVSDFVNLASLENPSKLGFLLSDSLKNSLSSKGIIIRQVEFGKDFTIGKHGFNMLTRDQSRIQKNIVNIESYAIVGTYTITNKKLMIFVKIIDAQTGYILSSSQEETVLTKEIIELSTVPRNNYIYQPLVL